MSRWGVWIGVIRRIFDTPNGLRGLQPDRTTMSNERRKSSLFQRRILIIRQDRIGDVVLATALPRELKRRWPTCRITMLVRGYTAPLFENNPHVDEVMTDDFPPHLRTSSFWRLVREVRRHRFTHALMLLPQARYNYLTFCAGIPFRLGHGIVLFHALTGVWPVMTRKFYKGRHEAEYSLDVARAMGMRSDDPTPEIHLSDREKEEVAARRRQWGDLPVVGLHITSGGSAPNWDPPQWAELASTLAASGRCRVMITDNEVPAEVSGLAGVDFPNAGQPLRHSLLTLSGLDLMVSASTGPMHMAGALGVPTLSLFCPLPSCEPGLWGPLGNTADFVLPAAEYCRDHCPGDPHVCRFDGSRQVSPRAVADRIQAKLAAETTA